MKDVGDVEMSATFLSELIDEDNGSEDEEDENDASRVLAVSFALALVRNAAGVTKMLSDCLSGQRMLSIEDSRDTLHFTLLWSSVLKLCVSLSAFSRPCFLFLIIFFSLFSSNEKEDLYYKTPIVIIL